MKKTSSSLRNNKNGSISTERSSSKGNLQIMLDEGEYAFFTSTLIFESNFIQVNRRGQSMCLHKQANWVTVGICASRPNLNFPNVMLLAHLVSNSKMDEEPTFDDFLSPTSEVQLVLSRALPLEFVTICIHDAAKMCLKVKLVSGRAYYLRLCAPPHKQDVVFQQWTELISLLKSTTKSQKAITFTGGQKVSKIHENTDKMTNAGDDIEINEISEQLVYLQDPESDTTLDNESSNNIIISEVTFEECESKSEVNNQTSLKQSETVIQKELSDPDPGEKKIVVTESATKAEELRDSRNESVASGLYSFSVFPLVSLSFPFSAFL
ncbi:protein FAM71D [Vombatus ursinus]|uniref:protein FAM71D n=1 Tax=Vombatus ursinus TaxID=29139 RepID=UPI000FFD96D3|nr:protein FAM71D [Vombatus ursinus]